MKRGFTLAEVLITLGIIGVVAAMTMPTLLQSYYNKITETRLAKFYSIMNQAIISASLKYGPPETWSDYWQNVQYDNENNLIPKAEQSKAVFEKYLSPYIKITTAKKINNYYYYLLADGSAFSFAYAQNSDIFFYPNNYVKSIKNRILGSNAFEFRFNAVGTGTNNKLHYKKGMLPFIAEWDEKEETLFTNTSYGCNPNSGNGAYCTELIRRNGWKIPKNYPRTIKY